MRTTTGRTGRKHLLGLGLAALLLSGFVCGGEARPRQTLNTNWYSKQNTWWETLIVSHDAMYGELDKARKETLAAHATDPLVANFRTVKAVCPKASKDLLAFEADVTGLKRVFLGTEFNDEVRFTEVCLVDADGVRKALSIEGKDSLLSGHYGKRQFKFLGTKDSGSSFTLNESTVSISLDGKYKALVGQFERGPARKMDAFSVTVTSTHPKEFEEVFEQWRNHLLTQVARDFSKDEQARQEIEFEVNKAQLFKSAWKKGDYAELVKRYAKIASPSAKARIEELAKSARSLEDVGKARVLVKEGDACDSLLAHLQYGTRPLVMAIEDLTATFPQTYPNGPKYLERARGYEKSIPALVEALRKGDISVAGKAEEYLAFQRQALLENPLLNFEKLLLIRGGVGLSSNWGGPNPLGNELVTLGPVKPDGEIKTVYSGGVTSYDLSWDAKKILFTDGGKILEMNSDGTGLRTITKPNTEARCYNPCRLPSGKIMFISTACEQAVPCTGGGGVGNMHVMDDDGGNERRITFDQDHNWDPCVLNNGRVVYTRWEYTDTPHYFTRLLMSMNPDGTDQKEYYGSSSYWPNAMYWARPLPGHSTQVVCIVSGHHGVSRSGELLVLDPAKGRHEASGVVQRIPGWGQKVEPVIKDNLVGDSWPKFIAPWPLAEPESNKGSGKYFLATVKMTPASPWGLYIVDVFDNMVPILMGGYSMPTPLRPRPMPPVVAERVKPDSKDATVYLVDVYEGGGIKGYPRGSVKALRIGSHHFRYPGNGDTRASSFEGGWDPKVILGTVPVYEDGSASFTVPANTPIFVQPLDEEGKSLQVMRSWFTAMPGEMLSCVGCHENQNSAPPLRTTIASKRAPAAIEPWYGPKRGFSFNCEVQPVLDRRCAGCHDGKDSGRPDLRAQRLHTNHRDNYSPSYMVLQQYVRRAGYESDYHLPNPAEYQADTSALVQMLKRGHHGVKLTREEWDRLYTWIDFNIPFAANWRESHRQPKDDQVARRAKYLALYAGIEDVDEEPVKLPEIAAFEAPAPQPSQSQSVKLDGWPLDAASAAALQKKTGLPDLQLDLGNGIKMTLVPVPAGRFVMGIATGFSDENAERDVEIKHPFYIGQLEVTNEQFAQFDPAHDSRYIDGLGKDRTTRGTPINGPKFPAVRLTWKQATAFCEWLSQKTGCKCSLPTEEQWEYACRAGASGPLPRAKKLRTSIEGGREKPNAWRIHDMTENVAEWTSSAYDPGNAKAFQDAEQVARSRVVRGPTWNDALTKVPTTFRWRYPTCQPVYNVGLRIVCEIPASK